MDLPLASNLTWEHHLQTNAGTTMRCMEHPRITRLDSAAPMYYVDGDKICRDWTDVQHYHDQPPVLTGPELEVLKELYSVDAKIVRMLNTVETRAHMVALNRKGCIDDDMRPTVLGLLVMSALSGGA